MLYLFCAQHSNVKDDLDDNDQDDADVWCTWKSFQSPPGGIFGIPPDKPFKDKQKGKKLFLWMKTLIVWLIIDGHCFQFLSQCCLLFTLFQFSFKGEMRDRSFSDRWVFLLRFPISPEPVMVAPAPSTPPLKWDFSGVNLKEGAFWTVYNCHKEGEAYCTT